MVSTLAAIIGAAFNRVWRWLAFSGIALIALRIIAGMLVEKGSRDTLREIERKSRDRTINHHELRTKIDRDTPDRPDIDERLRSQWVRD